MPPGAPDVQALLESAARQPWLPAAERQRGPVLDRRAIEDLIPHRDPFLFLDRITRVDPGSGLIVCRYDLHATEPVLAGHFPQHPVWPGVLQVEAIGQAGLCLLQLTGGSPSSSNPHGIALTRILAARFIRPVLPGAPVEIVTRGLADGLFTVLVGQCLQHDAVCSVAAVQGIHQEAGQ
jgi:3-hydroxyacyl-[acyl-carrier-protein] dehydratase